MIAWLSRFGEPILRPAAPQRAGRRPWARYVAPLLALALVGVLHATTLQAAILRVKLAHLDEDNARRRHLAALYDDLLAECDVIRPVEMPYGRHVYHLYVVRSLQRDALRAHLVARGVGTGIHYPAPVHLQPAYAALGYRPGALPVTERLAREVLSLPLYPELDEAAIAYVAEAVAAFDSAAPA